VSRRSVVRLTAGLLGQDVPAVVKKASVEDLLSLMADARRYGFSATGRSTWVENKRGDIAAVVLIPLGVESAPIVDVEAWRCYAGVVVKGKGPAVFTLDVSTESFSKLRDVSDSWDLAGMLLYDSFHVPIDAEE
jgi:hypothetical protein